MLSRGTILGASRGASRGGGLRRGLWLLPLVLSQVATRPVAMALDPHRSLDHYGHQVWRTDSGLPQNTVHAVLQTRDGYLWLGTDGGLVRFDGMDMVTFNAENTPQFKSDTVNALLEDDSGALWISTAAGLVRYRSGSFAAYTTAQGLPADTVWFSYQDHLHRIWAITTAGPAWFDGKVFALVAGAQSAAPINHQALAEDAAGRLWLGGSSGLFVLDIQAAAPRLLVHRLSGNGVEAVALDRQGNIWIGTNEGVERYAGLAPLPLAHVPGRPPGKIEVTALRPDSAGGMWVGSSTGLLHVDTDGTTVQAKGSDEEMSRKRVDSLFQDRQGVLWIAGERGILRLQGNQMQSFAPGSDLAANRVLSTYEDREGDLWLGTDSAGLNLLRDQKFTTYTTSDGLSGNLVRCVFQSNNGELWIGTDGAGLNRRTSTGFVHFTTVDGLSSNVILSLASGTSSDLWIGTPDGLNLLHPGPAGRNGREAIRVERFTSADGLPDDFIRSLYTDRDGSLWIGTRHGLSHLVDGKFTSFSSLDGLGSDFIGVIFRADRLSAVPPGSTLSGKAPLPGRDGGKGDLWVGTSGGLSRLHDGVFKNFNLQQGPANNSVTAIEQDRGQTVFQGALWLGTNGGGLNRFEQAVIPAFPNNAKALPSTIYGILEDARGYLWLSSRTGIYRVSVAELHAHSAGTAPAAAVAAYGTADGMNIRECSGGGHPAASKLADGTLWFATLDGVSFIDPLHARENDVPPPVVIERVLVDDHPRALDQDLTIRPGANRLEFQYAGLSFVAPQKVQYRYQLEGFDHGWIEAGNRRAAFYTNLPPGRYHFRVLAANNDGVWNDTGASFDLRFLPHFYQTYWFYTALALASLAFGYLVYRWRVLQVEAQFGAVLAERGRLAREIHDTLAQGFVAISVQLELVGRLLSGSREAAAKPVPDPVFQHLDQARALVRDSLAEARSSIWDLRSEAAGAEDLPSRLTQSCNRITSGSAAKVYLQVKGTYRPVARKTEDELLRIGQEAVTNAVRHAGAARIDVQLIYESTRVFLRVADDGRGFQPLPGASGPEGHFGIRGMHERADQIGAALLVESAPGAGTRISVEVPLV
jgi:ligand-binding sensor domain-containing protein/signal transduction histidine kinase